MRFICVFLFVGLKYYFARDIALAHYIHAFARLIDAYALKVEIFGGGCAVSLDISDAGAEGVEWHQYLHVGKQVSLRGRFVDSANLRVHNRQLLFAR